jgi:hypothetical protein
MRPIGDICIRCLTKHYSLECPETDFGRRYLTGMPQEPQTAASDALAAFSPWSRGFTYGDWPDLRDAVWEGDDSDE